MQSFGNFQREPVEPSPAAHAAHGSESKHPQKTIAGMQLSLLEFSRVAARADSARPEYSRQPAGPRPHFYVHLQTPFSRSAPETISLILFEDSNPSGVGMCPCAQLDKCQVRKASLRRCHRSRSGTPPIRQLAPIGLPARNRERISLRRF